MGANIRSGSQTEQLIRRLLVLFPPAAESSILAFVREVPIDQAVGVSQGDAHSRLSPHILGIQICTFFRQEVNDLRQSVLCRTVHSPAAVRTHGIDIIS